MGNFWAQLIGAVVNAVLPVIISLIQKLVPQNSSRLPAVPKGVTAEQHYRATVRTWVHEFLAEFGTALVTKGVIPLWLQPELPLIEVLVEQGLNTALDKAGL